MGSSVKRTAEDLRGFAEDLWQSADESLRRLFVKQLKPVGHIGNTPHLCVRFLGDEDNPVLQYPRHMNRRTGGGWSISMPLIFFGKVEHRPNIGRPGVYLGKYPPVKVIGSSPDQQPRSGV
jgi:hypothetical protein